MNKGLFLHIVTTMIYAILILYIIGDIQTTLLARIFIVMFFLLFNFIVAALCDTYEWYKKKI